MEVPNIPHPDVVPGKSDEDNEILYQEGDIPTLHQKAEPHWELASRYDLIDFNLGSKVTGSGFPFYKAKGAKLQRALISFFLMKPLMQDILNIFLPCLLMKPVHMAQASFPIKKARCML